MKVKPGELDSVGPNPGQCVEDLPFLDGRHGGRTQVAGTCFDWQ